MPHKCSLTCHAAHAPLTSSVCQAWCTHKNLSDQNLCALCATDGCEELAYHALLATSILNKHASIASHLHLNGSYLLVTCRPNHDHA